MAVICGGDAEAATLLTESATAVLERAEEKALDEAVVPTGASPDILDIPEEYEDAIAEGDTDGIVQDLKDALLENDTEKFKTTISALSQSDKEKRPKTIDRGVFGYYQSRPI